MGAWTDGKKTYICEVFGGGGTQGAHSIPGIYSIYYMYMSTEQSEAYLAQKGIRPTAARILVVQQLAGMTGPASLFELEAALGTLDKSTISRTLALLLEHHVVHAFEDGSGSVKYELCRSTSDVCRVGDRHIHFFCERCHRTFCLDNIKIPVASLPEGYVIDTINYMVKGLCPVCGRKAGR